ncbi:MAG: hypothetical protein KTR17_04350 [Cellvibrionaceae bacterium]|nr:hypothetical protein [Cellvibrionaceae bacterium]
MENTDLVWELAEFRRRERAQEFVLSIENKLCIYSSSAQQLYTNYNIFFPKEDDTQLVILPNPYAHQDTYHGIRPRGLRATGLAIVPMEPDACRGALAMRVPVKADSQAERTVPLSVCLKLIQRKLPSSAPFLPVLTKGDLRELDDAIPCLHLNILSMSSLAGQLNDLEIQDIKRLIQSRMKTIAQRA